MSLDLIQLVVRCEISLPPTIQQNFVIIFNGSHIFVCRYLKGGCLLFSLFVLFLSLNPCLLTLSTDLLFFLLRGDRKPRYEVKKKYFSPLSLSPLSPSSLSCTYTHTSFSLFSSSLRCSRSSLFLAFFSRFSSRRRSYYYYRIG